MVLFYFYGSLVINQVYGRIDNWESQLCIWKDSINCFIPVSNFNKFIPKKPPEHNSQIAVIGSNGYHGLLFIKHFYKGFPASKSFLNTEIWLALLKFRKTF